MSRIIFSEFGGDYLRRLATAAQEIPLSRVERLADALLDCWESGRQVFIFGNGGSAGNAIHLANDYLYGVSKSIGHALRVHALPANSAILTCLANDKGYEDVFSSQLAVLANPKDVAIALSGSGNSPNVLEALRICKELKVTTFAVLGFSGGQAKDLADEPIHIPIDDMQISEDLQLIVGHMLMQWLYEHRDQVK